MAFLKPCSRSHIVWLEPWRQLERPMRDTDLISRWEEGQGHSVRACGMKDTTAYTSGKQSTMQTNGYVQNILKRTFCWWLSVFIKQTFPAKSNG